MTTAADGRQAASSTARCSTFALRAVLRGAATEVDRSRIVQPRVARRTPRSYGTGGISAVDVQATLAELTATTIAAAIRNELPDCREVIVCGGGVHNDDLMTRLAPTHRNARHHDGFSRRAGRLGRRRCVRVARTRAPAMSRGQRADCDRRPPPRNTRRRILGPNTITPARRLAPRRLDTINLRLADYYINRELSQLAFNVRVLDQAKDTEVPLLERLNFLCISSTNLDEFFEIRVSGLKHRLEASAAPLGPDNLGSAEVLRTITEQARIS